MARRGTNTDTPIHTCTQACVSTYTHTHTHIQTRVHAHTHTHTRDRGCLVYLVDFSKIFCMCVVCFVFFFSNVYFWKREKQREGERKHTSMTMSRARAETDSVLTAVSPMRGSNSQTMRSWPELKSDVEQTEPSRHPCIFATLCLHV